MTTIEQSNQESNDSQGLGERVRDRLPVGLITLERRARAQWIAIPAQLRTAVDDLLARVRRGLDLPSRSEIDDLVERIEDLDSKLAALEASRAARPKPEPQAAEPKATKAKATRAKVTKTSKAKPKTKTKAKSKAKPAAASKNARRDAIKRAAKKKR